MKKSEFLQKSLDLYNQAKKQGVDVVDLQVLVKQKDIIDVKPIKEKKKKTTKKPQLLLEG